MTNEFFCCQCRLWTNTEDASLHNSEMCKGCAELITTKSEMQEPPKDVVVPFEAMPYPSASTNWETRVQDGLPLKNLSDIKGLTPIDDNGSPTYTADPHHPWKGFTGEMVMNGHKVKMEHGRAVEIEELEPPKLKEISGYIFGYPVTWNSSMTNTADTDRPALVSDSFASVHQVPGSFSKDDETYIPLTEQSGIVFDPDTATDVQVFEQMQSLGRSLHLSDEEIAAKCSSALKARQAKREREQTALQQELIASESKRIEDIQTKKRTLAVQIKVPNELLGQGSKQSELDRKRKLVFGVPLSMVTVNEIRLACSLTEAEPKFGDVAAMTREEWDRRWRSSLNIVRNMSTRERSELSLGERATAVWLLTQGVNKDVIFFNCDEVIAGINFREGTHFKATTQERIEKSKQELVDGSYTVLGEDKSC